MHSGTDPPQLNTAMERWFMSFHKQ